MSKHNGLTEMFVITRLGRLGTRRQQSYADPVNPVAEKRAPMELMLAEVGPTAVAEELM